MSGLKFLVDPRWSRARRTRAEPKGGVLIALKRWLGVAEPLKARKLDIRRPTGVDPHAAPPYRTRR